MGLGLRHENGSQQPENSKSEAAHDDTLRIKNGKLARCYVGLPQEIHGMTASTITEVTVLPITMRPADWRSNRYWWAYVISCRRGISRARFGSVQCDARSRLDLC